MMLHQPDPCFLCLKKHGMLHKSYIKLTYYCQHKVLLFLNEQQSLLSAAFVK